MSPVSLGVRFLLDDLPQPVPRRLILPSSSTKPGKAQAPHSVPFVAYQRRVGVWGDATSASRRTFRQHRGRPLAQHLQSEQSLSSSRSWLRVTRDSLRPAPLRNSSLLAHT
jgi:hypothetical protein